MARRPADWGVQSRSVVSTPCVFPFFSQAKGYAILWLLITPTPLLALLRRPGVIHADGSAS
jgi:hypothetical protein